MPAESGNGAERRTPAQFLNNGAETPPKAAIRALQGLQCCDKYHEIGGRPSPLGRSGSGTGPIPGRAGHRDPT